MKAGVSTACLYPMEAEKAFLTLAENGITLTEVFINSDCELRSPYLDEFMAVQREYGVKIGSVHPFTCGIEPMMLFTPYERRLHDMLDYYSRFFEFMNKVGATLFVLHGNKGENSCTDEFAFERFAALQHKAREFGVTVVQENVSRCVSRSLDYLKKMADALGDDAKFVIDIKQAHRSGEDPVKIVEALGSHIVHVHFSDSGKKGDCLMFGDGEYNSLPFFDALKTAGYDGNIIIELYRNSFDTAEELCESCHRLENFLAENNF